MSQVNATTIVADSIQTANVIVGNTTKFIINSGALTFTTGNVTANSTVLKLDNTDAPIYNTTINTTSISTAAIEINGTQYTKVAPANPIVDYQVFTNTVNLGSNYWYKPSWATNSDIVTIALWGGGGGGNTGITGSGGGGGACVIVSKYAGELNAICNVVVGEGGALNSPGGTSTFWSNSTFSISAYGGGAGGNTGRGGGGGWFSVGGSDNSTGGGPLGGANGTGIADSTFGGGGANSTAGGDSVYGGGSGAITNPGSSLYGGGGGANNAAGGLSVYGGRGGNSTVAATAPGGGGGANNTIGAGAQGEVRVWTTATSLGFDASPVYSIVPNTSVVYEGNSILFYVKTQHVANGTTLYYTLNNSSDSVATDFTNSVNGSVVINNGQNTFVLVANSDGIPDTESFWLDLRTDSTSGDIVANSITVTLSDIPGAQTFNTPSYLAYEVPIGITTVTIKAWGAGGGGTSYNLAGSPGTSGGPGGFVQGTFNVSPGETLTLYVGAGGLSANMGAGNSRGGGGGGLTGVFRGSIPLLIAGSGGGGGGSANGYYGGHGGFGGGSTAGSGGAGEAAATTGGTGGSQSAGGLGGTGSGENGETDGRYYGGDAGITGAAAYTNSGGAIGGGDASTNANYGGGGGGGGAGYYGGGGGEHANYRGGSGGGGGSNFVSGTNTVSTAGVQPQTAGAQTGVAPPAPNNTDPNYVAGSGTGGRGGNSSITTSTNGGNGLIVILFQ